MKNPISAPSAPLRAFVLGTALSLTISAVWAQTPATTENQPAIAQSAECAQMTQNLDADLRTEVKAGCQPTQAQISKMMDNPVGNLAMMVMQNDYTWVKIPGLDEYKEMDRFQLIPTFPVKVSDEWNLINRISIPLVSMPLNKNVGSLYGMSAGQIVADPQALSIAKDPFGRTNGLGDIAYVGLLSPSSTYRTADGARIIWGAGVAALFPTATQDVLGQGKYSIGPTGVIGYLGQDWSLGVFPQQFWSYAGSSSRASVNTTNIQYFIMRNLGTNWRVGMSPNIVVDWNASGGNKVTLPVGLGATYMVKIGGLPVRFGVEAQYSVVHPNDLPGSRWNLRLMAVPVVPTYMF